MDLAELIEGAIFVLAIAIWAFWKYRDRESLHKKILSDLQRNVEVKARRSSHGGKIITSASVLVILVAAVVVEMNHFTYRLGHYGNFMFYLILVELAIVAFLLLMMVIRDVKILKKG